MTIRPNSRHGSTKKRIGATRVRGRDLNHYADKIWVRVVELSLDDLLWAVKRHVCKLADIQLPRRSRDRLHLNQSVPTLVIDRYDVVRRHVAGERRGNESAPR